jgi:hypothetical protein
MKRFINFTPHAIKLNDGTVYPSQGVARVSASFTEFVDGICHQQFGDVVGLPEPKEGVCYIVSAIVLAAAKAAGRSDIVAPATGHPAVVRNEAGQIDSVPGFVS